jgi:hypothetical protein
MLEDIKLMSPDDLKTVSDAVLKEIVRRMYHHRREALLAKKDVSKMKQIAAMPNLTLCEAIKFVLKNSKFILDREEVADKILSTTSFKTNENREDFINTVYQSGILTLLLNDEIERVGKGYKIPK